MIDLILHLLICCWLCCLMDLLFNVPFWSAYPDMRLIGSLFCLVVLLSYNDRFDSLFTSLLVLYYTRLQYDCSYCYLHNILEMWIYRIYTYNCEVWIYRIYTYNCEVWIYRIFTYNCEVWIYRIYTYNCEVWIYRIYT
jgi:hypothetical protein